MLLPQKDFCEEKMNYPILENDYLKITVDPSHGGRIIGFLNKLRGAEQIWYDPSRLPVDPALDYDGNFAGGMDELLPNDPPEDGFPDHGELWTLPLNCKSENGELVLDGILPLSGLAYRRKMHLEGNTLISEYQIRNTTDHPVDFLWKLHAALQIECGDELEVPAQCIQAADPGDWSKASHGMPLQWKGKYIVPEMDGSSDFFFLTGLTGNEIRLKHRNGTVFSCSFDPEIFRCVWIFASFGRLNGSRTLIMEPCTNYPGTLAEARRMKVCAKLNHGECIQTTVKWTVIN